MNSAVRTGDQHRKGRGDLYHWRSQSHHSCPCSHIGGCTGGFHGCKCHHHIQTHQDGRWDELTSRNVQKRKRWRQQWQHVIKEKEALSNISYHSQLRQIDRGSRLLHRTSSFHGCTLRCHSGTLGTSSDEPQGRQISGYHSSGATRPSRRSSRHHRRKPTGVGRKRCCCTGRMRSCRWGVDRRPRRCRRHSPPHRRTRRRTTHIGHCRSGTHCLCTALVLKERRRWSE